MNSNVIPCLLYRDAQQAIRWLCDAFGFQEKAVYANPDGSIAHAELTLGGGMIMVGSVKADATEFSRFIKQPDEIDQSETQTPYVVVTDADEIFSRVNGSGGKIVIDIKDESYGGRGFACRDPEGHLWYVGTYDPWKEATEQKA